MNNKPYTIIAEEKLFKDLKKYDIFSPMDTSILEAIEVGDDEYIEENLFLIDHYFKNGRNEAVYISEEDTLFRVAKNYKIQVDKFKANDPVIFWSIRWD